MGSRLLCSSRFSLPLFSDVSLFTQESTSVYIKYRLTQMSVHLSCFWKKLYRRTWSISDVASSGNWVSRVPCLLCWYWVWSDWQRLGIGHETWLSPSWFLQSPSKPSKIVSEWLAKVILFLHSNLGQNDFGLLWSLILRTPGQGRQGTGTASSMCKLVAWGWVFWKRNHLITFDFNLSLPWPPLQDILKPESARKEPQAFHWNESKHFPVACTETGQSPWLP